LTNLAIWAESHQAGAPIMGLSTAESGLPWETDREDLAHFRAQTRNHVLVMGRGTFEKLPAALKTPKATFERPLIILTHSTPLPKSIEPPLGGYWYAGTFETPQDLERFAASFHREKPLAIIGGPTVIEWAEPIVDTVSVTYIAGPHAGDVRAPENAFLEQFPNVRHLSRTSKNAMIEMRTRA